MNIMKKINIVTVIALALSIAVQSSSVKAEETAITISAAGDCTLGSDSSSPQSVNFYAVYNQKKNAEYFFKNVKKYFEADDMTIVNFEGTLTKRTTRSPKKYAFKGNPSYVNILKKGSIEAVAFANNHCRDYGQGSYTDTIQVFQNKGITYSSYGKVSIYKTKGKRIGMISINGLESISSCKNYIKNGIKKLKKKKADLFIVSMHSGIERQYTPTSTQKELAHYAVNQGANLVLGHHPHVVQGIEKYKGVYIAYSLGNFCFGGNTNPGDKDTMIFQQTFTFRGNKLTKKKEAKIIPCSLSSRKNINNYQPTPLKGKEKKRVIKKVNQYSKSLKVKIAADGSIQ
jgi:poly-gamma-glutamate synthesis protein (capsule biosynthesis protein)